MEEFEFAKQFYGKPFSQRRHFLGRLCHEAQVRPFGFHAIRHRTASILFHQGESVAVIQAVLRHQSPTHATQYLHRLGLEQTRAALEGLTRKAEVIPFTKRSALK